MYESQLVQQREDGYVATLPAPRRRQKIGPNPRGKFFLEDEDNKGRAMLSKLGWQKGDGLGRTNQGMQAPICPKIQMDGKGLGFDPKSDPWIAHTQEFSQILENLQAIHTVKEEVPEKDEGVEEEAEAERKRKLEKKSKSSKCYFPNKTSIICSYGLVSFLGFVYCKLDLFAACISFLRYIVT